MFTRHPAVTDEFRSSSFILQMQELLDVSSRAGYRYIIFESISPTVLIQFISVDDFRIAFRSFDVLHLAFQNIGRGVSRFLWNWEASKVSKLEAEIVRRSDSAWAICRQDFEDYSNCEMTLDGIMGISINTSRYANVSDGDELVATHLGGTDSRKMGGLLALIKSWGEVRERLPSAQLLLGGRGTEELSNPNLGIVGFGFVEDDRDFLGRGKVTINSQLGGSGIKLKSLNALASSRVLVATADGARGVEGVPGEHYLLVERAEDFSDKLITALERPHPKMREAGRQHVVSKFSQNALAMASIEPIEKFVDG
jgi:glycosyltransferase involved in cell wall biosynthesis